MLQVCLQVGMTGIQGPDEFNLVIVDGLRDVYLCITEPVVYFSSYLRKYRR